MWPSIQAARRSPQCVGKAQCQAGVSPRRAGPSPCLSVWVRLGVGRVYHYAYTLAARHRTHVLVCACARRNIAYYVIRLYKHYINHNQTLFTSMFRSLSETFVRKSCSVLLPVLACDVARNGCTLQCIAALVPRFIERRPSFRVCTASLIHLVPLLHSLSRIVDSDQLISCHVTSLPWQEAEEQLNNFFRRRSLDGDRNVK